MPTHRDDPFIALRLASHEVWLQWSSRAGEISGWARLLAPLALWWSAIRRRFRPMLAVLIFVAFSPRVYSGAREDTWMNRAVRGEAAWLRDGDGGRDRWLTLGWVGAVLLSIVLALAKQIRRSLFWLLSGVGLGIWHHDRMARDHVARRLDGTDI